MYARLVTTPFGTITPAEAATVADRIEPQLREQHGFVQVVWLLDEKAGQYGNLSVWESEDDAAAGWTAIGAQVMNVHAALGLSAKQPLEPQHFQVCAPTPVPASA
jgi:heme-degrading monooxygenase HmoA